MKILFLMVFTVGVLSYVSSQTTSTPVPTPVHMLARRAIVACGESDTGGSCSCDSNTAAATMVLLNCNNVPANSQAL